MAVVSDDVLAGALLKAGFSPDDAVIMLAIGKAESSGDVSARGDGGTSWGWLQIHGPPFPGWNTPLGNALAARSRYLARAAFDPPGFNAWCTYEGSACGGHGRGSYRAHLAGARATVARVTKAKQSGGIDLGGAARDAAARVIPGGEILSDLLPGGDGGLLPGNPITDFVRTNALRAAEVAGGALLILLGLVFLAVEAIL